MPKQKFFLIILSCLVIFGLVACTKSDISVSSIISDKAVINGQISEIININNTGLVEIIKIVDEKIMELR